MSSQRPRRSSSTRRNWRSRKRMFGFANHVKIYWKLVLIHRTLASDAFQEEQVIIDSSFDKAKERTTFQLPNGLKLSAGSKAELKIRFEAKITGNMMGYYKSSWEHEGKTKNYALTQFEVGDLQLPWIIGAWCWPPISTSQQPHDAPSLVGMNPF